MKHIKKYTPITIIVLLLVFFVLELPSVHNFVEENYGFNPSPSDLFGHKLADNAVEIITSKDKYKVGEEIFFAVQNRTDKTLRLENECPFEPLETYRLENNIWKHLKAKTDINCADNEDILLAPYELKGSSYLPWSKVIFNTPGKYRLEMEVIGYKNNFQKEFEIVK